MSSSIFRFDDLTIRKLFGSENAEGEERERFHEYFVENRAYENLISPLPLRILVGHKGVGKSALLRYAYENDIDQNTLAVFLKPDDVADLLLTKPQDDINSRIEAWKLGIKQKVAQKSIQIMVGELNDNINDSAIKYTTKKISSIVLDTINALYPEKRHAGNEVVFNNFIKNRKITVYIDDIDRGWSARPQDILNISALINALRDLSSQDRNFSCRIALRTDVYFLVRTSDESTDKIEQDIIRLTWKNYQILKLMAFRIATYFNMNITKSQIDSMDNGEITR